jgi:hypothetical protein
MVLSLSLAPIGSSLNSQSITPADKPSQNTKIQLSYHVKAIKRDSAGQYTMSGTVDGELQGRATLVFGFDDGPSGPGKALVHSYWVVTAEPVSESFKAKLNGTVEVVSGQTHLVGEITEGPNKGRRVETNSRLLNFGPNHSLSDIDGNMVIDGK